MILNEEDIKFLIELQNELKKQDGEHICCGNCDHDCSHEHEESHHCHCKDFYEDCKFQAKPRYWNLIQDTIEPTAEEYADYTAIILESSEGVIEFSDSHALCNYMITNGENIIPKDELEIFHIYSNDLETLCDKYQEFFNEEIKLVPVRKVSIINTDTGCFLTKKAAMEYLDKFGYNHPSTRIYANTAYRNFELEKLLNIIQNTDWSKLRR